MRSAPFSTAASKTLREPSTFTAWLAALAWMTVNARCTTTSAPFTASCTLARSCTSPCRYSVFRHPRLAGSKGRRAMPTIRLTRRERSRADTSAIPRSPVGPVTATVSPSLGTGVLYPLGLYAACAASSHLVDGDLLAALENVQLVGDDGVPARAALHHVALAVVHVDLVVAAAGRDLVVTGSADHVVVSGSELPAVVARPGVDPEGAVLALDLVVAVSAHQPRRPPVGEDVVVAGAPVGVVGAAGGWTACVDPVVVRSPVQAVGSRLAEDDVVAPLAQDLVVVLTRIGHVVAVAQPNLVGTASPEHQ